MSGGEEVGNLDYSAHNSTSSRAFSCAVSVEGDYVKKTIGGGCGQAYGPPRRDRKTRERRRADDADTIQRSLSSFSRMNGAIGGIIRASCPANSDRVPKFATLTYASADADLFRAKNDAKRFVDRLKRLYPGLDYLTILEPHELGDWHVHLILLLPIGVSDVTKECVSDAWGHGSVQISEVWDAHHLASYFNPFSPKKRSRQKYYPLGERTYFASQGMLRPQKYRGLSLQQARDITRDAQLVETLPFGPPGIDVGVQEFYFNDKGAHLNGEPPII